MPSPAFQFYPADWLASQRVTLMTLEEEGAYIRLICYCWQHGSIPRDADKCARLIGKGASTTLATVVQAMFEAHPADESKLVHSRLEQERQKQAIWREKSSLGGRKSAAARRKSRVVQPPLEGSLQNGGNQKATLHSSSSSSSPSSSSSADPDFRLQSLEGVERGTGKRTLPDDAWLATLRGDPTYAGIDIDRELGKCRAWCKTNGKPCSRKRFINWINRERPLAANGAQGHEKKPLSILDLRTILQAKEGQATEIRNRYATETGLHTTWSDEGKRRAYVALRNEIKDLNAKISNYAH